MGADRVQPPHPGTSITSHRSISLIKNKIQGYLAHKKQPYRGISLMRTPPPLCVAGAASQAAAPAGGVGGGMGADPVPGHALALGCVYR